MLGKLLPSIGNGAIRNGNGVVRQYSRVRTSLIGSTENTLGWTCASIANATANGGSFANVGSVMTSMCAALGLRDVFLNLRAKKALQPEYNKIVERAKQIAAKNAN